MNVTVRCHDSFNRIGSLRTIDSLHVRVTIGWVGSFERFGSLDVNDSLLRYGTLTWSGLIRGGDVVCVTKMLDCIRTRRIDSEFREVCLVMVMGKEELCRITPSP